MSNVVAINCALLAPKVLEEDLLIASEPAGITVIHQLSKRLRLRVTSLRSNHIDSAKLSSALLCLSGVDICRVSNAAASVMVGYDGTKATQREIIKLLLSAPTQYKVTARDKKSSAKNNRELGKIFSALIPILHYPFVPVQARFAMTVFTTAPIMLEGLQSVVQRRRITTEFLDALAIGISTFTGEYLTANFTHLLLQMGEYLEHSTERSSTQMLEQLIQTDIDAQVWIEKEGQQKQIAANEVVIGDIVVVGTGHRILIDGVIVSGVALVNQTSITGESVPVKKDKGDAVHSGSVVEEGQIKIWAEHVGNDTTMARMGRFIESSLQQKSFAQKRGDEMAQRLVPITLGLAGGIFALTRNFMRTAAVLQADYSCALKLTTPVVLKSSMYSAARHGILVKGGQALEDLANVETLVFDKTGTLTEGRLAVEEVIPLAEGWNSESLLNLAASAEEHYFHPVAEAIVKAAKEKSFTHWDHGEVTFIVAHGVTTTVENAAVHIGSRHFLESHHSVKFSAYEQQIKELLHGGHNLLYIAKEEVLLGMIALTDTLRSEAKATLARLKQLGIKKFVMLTGDHHIKANALASELNIDQVIAEVMPEDKASIVEQLQKRGQKIAFVGDGVNDSPALAIADVGISMHKGSELAQETADISLMEDSLTTVANAVEISQKSIKQVNNNFNLAVGVNSLILLGASTNLLSPIVTSILHNGTTISLLVNALRMRNFNTKL